MDAMSQPRTSEPFFNSLLQRDKMADILDKFRASIPQNIESFFDYTASAQTDLDAHLLFGRLIGELAFSRPALALVSNSNESFQTLLVRFLALWTQRKILPRKLVFCCSSLLEKVASNKPDLDVWYAVYELLEEFSRTLPETPPPPDSVLKSSTFDTPAESNAGTSHRDSQIRDEVDHYLRLELAGAVYTDARGFGTRFGEPDISAHWVCATNCGSSCTKRAKCPAEWDWNDDIVHDLPPWPKRPLEKAVLEWFGRFNSRIPKRMFYGSRSKELGDSNSKVKRQCDIFLSPTILDDQARVALLPEHYQHSWHNVLVPGKLKSDPSQDGETEVYLRLASYVREVFGAQCGRRYVHAFSICGDIMRCYIFDRGGGSISHSFHIGKNQKTFNLFVQILRSYVQMSPTLLGFDPTIQTESGQVFLPIKQNLDSPMFVIICGRRFRLLKVVFHRSAIVSRGTTCWVARDEETGENCVVKDAWRSDLHRPEGELYALAKEKGVFGLPDCRFDEDVKVDNIRDDLHENVRKGLTYGSSTVVEFPQKSANESWEAMFNTSRAGTSRVSQLKLTKNDGDNNDNNTGLISSTSKLNQLKITNKGESTDATLASSTSKLSLKALLMESSVRDKPKDSIERQMKDGNRIHTRLVFYTIGREIYRFKSTQELLEAFHGAITCHWSLVRDGGILHRDVSINNIMIACRPREGEPKGFLIDLDMAQEIDSNSSGAIYQIGTMEFMAINVLLRRQPHTYRDDLESFFYVLIWICVMYESTGHRRYVRDAQDEICPPTVLDGWSSAEAAGVKHLQMFEETQFEDILNAFSDRFRELGGMMKEIRRALFQGGLTAGNDEARDRLYDAFLGILQRQLNKMSEGGASEAST